MKKITQLLLIFALAIASCKKEDSTKKFTCSTCKQSAEALAENDASSKGIYKGVVIGSSGTIEFNIANNNSTITATMVLDGNTVNLTSNVTWSGGQAFIAPFTGTLNGNAVSITFSVDPNGSNPIVTTANIPGHPNTVFTITKETSNNLVECFEGQYTEGAPDNTSGTFNIVLSRTLKKWSGYYKQNNSTSGGSVGGQINSSNQLVDTKTGYTMATLNGDEISGQFTNSTPATVTVNGQRSW